MTSWPNCWRSTRRWRACVRDGDTVAMEGFTHLIPHAAGHEIIRQGRRHLHLVRMTPDVVYDQLIGAGCVDRLTFSWGGNPGVGSLQRFRDAVENGWPHPLQIEEHSHAGMATRYAAGAAGLPFGVLRGYVGTDLAEHTNTIRRSTCPFTGERLTAVPALNPDVSIIHAQQRRPRGQCPDLGPGGRAEGGRARRRPLDRDGRADRRPARPDSGQHRVAELGASTAVCEVPRRRPPLLRDGLLDARQRLLPRLGRRSRRIATASRPGSTSTCSAPATTPST